MTIDFSSYSSTYLTQVFNLTLKMSSLTIKKRREFAVSEKMLICTLTHTSIYSGQSVRNRQNSETKLVEVGYVQLVLSAKMLFCLIYKMSVVYLNPLQPKGNKLDLLPPLHHSGSSKVLPSFRKKSIFLTCVKVIHVN